MMAGEVRVCHVFLVITDDWLTTAVFSMDSDLRVKLGQQRAGEFSFERKCAASVGK